MRTALRSLLTLFAFGAFVVSIDPPAQARTPAVAGYEPGTIIVKTSARRLYFVLENGEVITYPVGVGKTGRTWTGVAYISGKFIKPAWSPPAEVRRDKPSLPDVIPGGSSENPMGAARDDAQRRSIRDPRHQQTGIDRRLCFLRLHPHE